MAISLTKGQKINLSKADGSQLTNILIGLGWKEVQASGGLFGMFKQKVDVDIDASVLMLDAGGKIPSPEEVIFFNHKDHATGCIHHCGDNLVGGKMGGMDDSEQIQVDLTKVPQASNGLFLLSTSTTASNASSTSAWSKTRISASSTRVLRRQSPAII